MAGKSSGLLAALLLSVPLAAIPLMAVFGIPQIAIQLVPQKETSTADAETEAGETEGSWEEDYERNAADLLSGRAVPAQPAGTPLASGWSGPGGTAIDFEREADPASNTHSATQPPSGTAYGISPESTAAVPLHADEGARGASSPGTLPQSPLLTWPAATHRLAELGITQYYLERGTTDGSYLFVCMFHAGERGSVTQRFESEAADPLMAVSQVLNQVDRWLQRRYVQSRQFATAPVQRDVAEFPHQLATAR